MALKIYICEKKQGSLEFLKGFFKSRKSYNASFFSRPSELKKKMASSPADLIIAGVPGCLEKLANATGKTPIIAMISDNQPKAMRSIINMGIEHYMLPPFQDYDIRCKLEILSRRIDYIALLTQEKKDLETLADISNMVSSTLDPEEVLYLIVKKLSEIIPVSRCSILSVDSGKKNTAEVISTFEHRDIGPLELKLKNYPEIRKALRTKDTIIINDAAVDPLMKTVRTAINSLEIKSIMVIPVMFRSEVIGTLFLRTSRKSYAFTEREKKLCKKIAGTAAKALNNAYLFQEIRIQRAELEKLAITDHLTGIYNIRYLYHRMESEFSSAIRYKSPLSCIMMDIDHFKRINDTYGHRTGDKVLMEFASIVREYTRKSDVFARYGGEEFILLLPHSDIAGATAEARRIQGMVKKHHFKSLKKSTHITISLGVSNYPHHKKIKTQDDLIGLADNALLQAKNEGRDRVVAY